MKTLYLVDASNMFFRAFFAIPPLTNEKGMPTNALYGFLAMSLKLMRDVRPDYLVYCFDRKEPSFRNELYPEYKAHREEMPDLLKPQIPYLKQLTEHLGIRILEKAGFEADDVIGTLAELGAKNGVHVEIVSGDKDFAQLVRPGISLYDTMKDLRTDVDGVNSKFGVRPDQIVDYLAMVGDASDNVPGVRGIGPKGAARLLNDYGTLENIYEHIDEIKGATHKKLLDGKDDAFVSKKLVTIVRDVDLNVKWEDLRLREPDRDPMRALLQELGFNSFERKLFGDGGGKAGSAAPAVPAAKTPGVSAITDSRVEKQKVRRPASSSCKPEDWVEVQWTVQELKQKIEPYSEIWGLLDERGLYLGYRGKFLKVAATDIEIGEAIKGKHLRWKGYDVKQVLKALRAPRSLVVWDGMLAAYIVRSDQIGTFDETYEQYCGRKLPELCLPLDRMRAHLELEEVLRHRLADQDGGPVFENFDLPLVPVLTGMELRGVRVDLQELGRQSQALQEDIKRVEQLIHKEAGEIFNISSPKQLGHILFERLGLPVGKKTKTGYSTDSDVLEGLITRHPIARMILEYRELAKLKSTYVDALPALVSPVTGRVHSQLNQAATATGRLSSTHPNLQNIPIRTPRGRLVRRAFIADPGRCLISADYSQIELRVLAHITEDEGLTSAFMDDLDIHSATAAEIFGKSVDAVTPNDRRIAKAVNFGLAYGQGASGLADALGIPRGEATEIIQRYFRRFAGVKRYMEDTVRLGMEQGYVATLFGRRRYIDELQSKNPMIRRAGERAAINAPIQGTAADLVKLAMIQVNASLPIPLLLQVHDELLFECLIEDADEMCGEIKSIMETVYKMKVPLKVNVGRGPNWDDAH
jgi:DNA polymerase-1